MIDLTATEIVIETLITELDLKAKIITHPGTLDDNVVNPRMITNLILSFKSIDYEAKRINPKTRCFSRLNTVNFNITINNNNLREHRVVYDLAQQIIVKLRGEIVARDLNGLAVSTASPIYISSFTYLPYDNDKACNKAEIVLSFDYVESYTVS